MNIVDLFSGAGGLTFGFYYKLVNNKFIKNNNCNIIFANEYNLNASKAFKRNFPFIPMINKDIKLLMEAEIKEYIGELDVDLVIGGPPCQSYSTIGKRRFDDKAKMYEEYYRILSIIKPKMFLFENVKGILSMKNNNGDKVIDDIENKFKCIGYNFKYRVLDAADYGIPQHRERLFIIGSRKDINIDWDFDKIKKTKKKITVKEAISDFPFVSAGSKIETYGNKSATNNYQKMLRNPLGIITCHFSSRHGKKIQTIIENVIQGEGKNYINKLVDEGKIPKQYKLTSGYNNTYGRLVEDKPCTTITNNMSTPSALRCIHYHEHRALTPREGARIQSFPDWFEFFGSKKDITTQIGNAVPPLLSIKIAEQIEKTIQGYHKYITP